MAVPAVAIAATADPDPIYAAIKQWKEAVAVELAGFDAQNTAHTAFKDRYGSIFPSGMPRGLAEIFERKSPYKCNPYWMLRTHEQITELKSHADWKIHVPYFHRLLNIQTDDYEANVAPFEEAAYKATSNRIEAAYAVFGTAPTTLAGMRAKIDWARSVDHVTGLLVDNEEQIQNFLNTL